VYLNADYTATPKLVFHAGFDFTRHNALQNSAVQNFDAITLGLNTAADMPGGAARTFPIISGLNVNRAGVPNLGINNAPFYDDNWYPTVSATWDRLNMPTGFRFNGRRRSCAWTASNMCALASTTFWRPEASFYDLASGTPTRSRPSAAL
jgi:hypothetical protein